MKIYKTVPKNFVDKNKDLDVSTAIRSPPPTTTKLVVFVRSSCEKKVTNQYKVLRILPFLFVPLFNLILYFIFVAFVISFLFWWNFYKNVFFFLVLCPCRLHNCREFIPLKNIFCIWMYIRLWFKRVFIVYSLLFTFAVFLFPERNKKYIFVIVFCGKTF